jgi:hypothetical protein
MRDPAWLDDVDDPDEPGHRRSPGRVRPLLVVLAAVPWLLVVALFVVPGRTDTGAPADPDGPAPAAADATDIESPGPAEDVDVRAAGDPDTGGNESAGGDADDVTGGATGTPDAASDHPLHRPGADTGRAAAGTDLAAIAILAARGWLSGADRHEDDVVPASHEDGTYAEHLYLEALEGDGDLLVARVVALLLDVDASTAPRLQRVAVPLAATPDGPRLLGAPWELPSPVLDVTALATEPLADPLLVDEAEQALRRAGFADPRVVRLARTTGWPLVVTFRTDGQATPRQVWLRTTHDGRLDVAGLTGPDDAVERGAAPDPDPPEDAGGQP